MIKVSGFDKLQKDMEQAQRAFDQIDGQIASVQFDPNDPESIEAAIQETYRIIDEKVGQYASNPFVQPLMEQFKEACRDALLEKAAEARLTGEEDQ